MINGKLGGIRSPQQHVHESPVNRFLRYSHLLYSFLSGLFLCLFSLFLLLLFSFFFFFFFSFGSSSCAVQGSLQWRRYSMQ